jgi:hypothetical protein
VAFLMSTTRREHPILRSSLWRGRHLWIAESKRAALPYKVPSLDESSSSAMLVYLSDVDDVKSYRFVQNACFVIELPANHRSFLSDDCVKGGFTARQQSIPGCSIFDSPTAITGKSTNIQISDTLYFNYNCWYLDFIQRKAQLQSSHNQILLSYE